MHYGPISEGGGGRGGGGGGGAVPHRTYPGVNAPWAPPGSYTVRLTAEGKTYTQPLNVRLDPRVKTPTAGLTLLAALTREMYDGARTAHAAFTDARSLVAQLDKAQGADIDAFKAQVEALAPAPAAGGGGRGGRGGRGGGGGAAAPPGAAAGGAAAAQPAGRGRGRGGAGRGGAAEATTLEAASGALLTAAMSMQAADVAPTANQVAACAKARTESNAVLAQWNTLRTSGLAALNTSARRPGSPW
jgi:hypothetical protein